MRSTPRTVLQRTYEAIGTVYDSGKGTFGGNRHIIHHGIHHGAGSVAALGRPFIGLAAANDDGGVLSAVTPRDARSGPALHHREEGEDDAGASASSSATDPHRKAECVRAATPAGAKAGAVAGALVGAVLPRRRRWKLGSADRDDVRAVRAECREAAVAWGMAARADDVELAVGELVGNAVRHGSGPVTVSMRADRGGVYCGIQDTDPALPHMRDTEADPWDEHGRGLAIVDSLSQEWGYRRRRWGHGKTVWCRITVTPE